MESEKNKGSKTQVARGLRNGAGIVPIQVRKNNTTGLNRGPEGNQFGLKHGLYSNLFNDEEKLAREELEKSFEDDLGGSSVISSMQRTLITTAGMLTMKLSRVDKAIREGRQEPVQEHVLALVNSLRLILCALGLEKRAKASPSLQDYLKQKSSGE
jgi:hypothetical protein